MHDITHYMKIILYLI